MSRARAEALLWLAQRASAAVLGVWVPIHLVTIVAAVRGGLSATEILERTQGSAAWAVYYAVFVLAVSIHAPIGLRTVARETLGWRGPGLELATLAAGVALALFGWRAVAGLVMA
ncbi:MAG: succinate dehydrogenase [Alphaproteobacteria bacterium]|nr:succinate dehydrogenase [Alphaproteobacteria bacterium]